jgi:hypothetical protein
VIGAPSAAGSSWRADLGWDTLATTVDRLSGIVRCGLGAAALAAIATPAAAGPYSVVPSAADPGDPIDIHIRLDYAYEIERSVILRERVGAPGTDPTDPIPELKDLVFRQTRHSLTPRLELGVFHDLWLSAALPIVIAQARGLKFDQRSAPCSFVGPDATCVNRDNSSTILDGLLPPEGFDAGDPAGFAADDDDIFQGPSRRGLDQIHVGLGIAPMNQSRDPTKPTWKIEAELRIPVGKVARLDRDDPSRHRGVGKGVYEVALSTSIARRLGWAEPFFALRWQAPFKVKEGSVFEDPGFGARQTSPQQEAGIHFGFEAIIVDRPADSTRVGIELSGTIDARFEGRSYTPMWEVFAYAGDVRHGGPLILDADPTQPGMQARSHPGITDTENYLELGAKAAVRADIGPSVHLAGFATLATATQHVITFDDAGVDRPTCTATNTTRCETDVNDVVNPGTDEVNPLHTPLKDLVGHRYLAADNLAVAFGLEAIVMF